MSTSEEPTGAFDRSRGDRPTRSFAGSAAELSVEQALLLDEACNTFEAKWRGRGRPDILAALLELPEGMRPVALKELVALDVFYRRKGCETPTVAEYAERFPKLDPDWLAEIVGGDGAASGTSPQNLEDARRSAAMSGERIGAVIAGKYTLIEVIGEGGMGSVFLARQSEPVKRDERDVSKNSQGSASEGTKRATRYESEAATSDSSVAPPAVTQAGGGLNRQGQVHLLLAHAPLPKLSELYPIVFEEILQEKTSTLPVKVR